MVETTQLFRNYNKINQPNISSDSFNVKLPYKQ